MAGGMLDERAISAPTLMERLRAWWRHLISPHTITCPACGTSQLRQVVGYGVYSQPFECLNGHRFQVPI